MAVILSNYVSTQVDQSGNPKVNAWLFIEFRAASYQPGGEFVDVTPYVRYGVGAVFGPVSGALLDKVFELNMADLPQAGLVSARVKIFRPNASGLVFGEQLSGTAISGTRTWMLLHGW